MSQQNNLIWQRIQKVCMLVNLAEFDMLYYCWGVRTLSVVVVNTGLRVISIQNILTVI